MTWEQSVVAEDATHHRVHGRPLYEARFEEVLPFRPPGLAPVRRATEAWHIDAAGRPAYKQRFLRTFGYYEGRAAVVSKEVSFHILPDGAALYPERYPWCGNFQGGRCPVRTSDGLYFHVDLEGLPAYAERWRYAGDFREGTCVVQGTDGRSTHIDRRGQPLHGHWFLDLDAYHKGYARARDEDGWLHVNRAGSPAYGRRFALVEPFYNGQARVERDDGGREIIDEAGQTVIELRPSYRSEFSALSGDLVGFWRTEAICSAVEVGIFESLPGTAEEIALRCGLDSARTFRMLRALSELKLVAREGDAWSVTPRGEHLREDHSLTMADAAVEYGRYMRRHWEALPDALRREGGWAPPDIFGQVAAAPERVPGFHRMLRSYARHDYAPVPEALALRGDEVVIDAGGGVGVLAEVLLRHHPRLRVVLLDRPEVISIVTVGNDVSDRLTLAQGDIHRPWDVRGEAVVLARVLHDWDEGVAAGILRNARAALPQGGRLFVVDMVLPEEGHSGALCDLHLLMVTGGQERTSSEYASLLRRAGFEFQEVRYLPVLPSVIVGVAR